MKKLLIIIALILIVSGLGADSFANQTDDCRSSGILNASAVIVARAARLTDIAIYTDGTNAVTVTCYDNKTAASGTVLAKAIVAGASLNGGSFIPIPIRAASGIYCSLSGTGGSMIILYDPQ